MCGMTDASSPLATLSAQLAALAEAGAARTVAVHGRDGRPRSGILWAQDLVVTAEEPLERDDAIVLVLPDGTKVAAELAGRDPGTDIALLRAPTGPVAPLPLAPAAEARAGHLILALAGGEHGPRNALGSVALAG
ncbi:MAG: serine protease, partial [Acetobacteraceae bacterium]|nr:serine protease [Acetobacteraceae bacterium]